MTTNQALRHRFPARLPGMFCLLLAPLCAHAAAVTKANTGTDLNDPASWIGGATPTWTDVATWSGTALGAGLTLASNTSWLGLSVAGAASEIGITGAGTLTLGAGGLNASLATVNLTLGIPIALVANQTWTVSSGLGLTAAGPVSGAFSLTNAGPGTLTLSGANTYSGTTTVKAGTLTLSGNRTATSGAINVGQDANLATVNLQGGSFSLGSAALAVGNGTVGTNGIVHHTAGAISFTSGNAVLVGNGSVAGTVGVYNLSGGSLTGFTSATRGVILGVNAGCSGIFVLSGSGNLNLSGGALFLARSDSAADNTSGAFYQTGGSASVGTLTLGSRNLNTGGSAKLMLTGGTFTNSSFTKLAVGTNDTATILIGGTADVTLPAFPTARGSGSTATLTFNGGTLRPSAASAAYLSGLNNAYLTANGANFNVPSGKDITIAQTLEDAPAQVGILTKAGAGTLTLSGYNTYSGSTTVSGGTLQVNGSLAGSGAVQVQSAATLCGSSGWVNGPVTVCSGGTLAVGDGTGAGNLTLGSLTLGAASGDTQTLNVTLNGTSLTTISVTGALAIHGTTTLNVRSLGIIPAGAYPVITYAGPTVTSGFVLGAKPVGSTLLYSVGSLVLVVPDALKWTGVQSALWDAHTTNWQWFSAATPATYTNDVALLFDDTLSAHPDLTLNTTVAPGGVQFNHDITAYSLSGTGCLAGAGSLIKSGAGVAILGTANTYSGGTTLLGTGLLAITNSAALGTGPLNLKSAQVDGSPTVLLSGGITVTNPVIMDSTTGREAFDSTNGNNTLAGPITIASVSTFTNHLYFQNAGDPGTVFTVGGAIDGPTFPGSISLRGASNALGVVAGQVTINSGFQINGSATWTVASTSNTWTQTIIQGANGSLMLGTNDALATGARVTWDSRTAGALDLAGYNQTVAGLECANVPTYPALGVGNSSTTSDSRLSLNGGGYVFAGTVMDTLGAGTRKLAVELVSGTQTLTGDNLYSGPTTIGAGVLNIGNGGATGSLSNTAAITNNGALVFNRSGDLTFANAIVGTGTLTSKGAGTLTLSGPNTYRGGTTITNGAVLATSLGSGPVALQRGGKLGAGSANTVATLALGGDLNCFNSGLLFDIIDPANADKLVVAGNLTPSGVTTLTLAKPAPLPNGQYTLIEVAGTLAGGAINFTVASQPPKVYTLAYVPGTPNRLVLQVSGSKTWLGDGLANQWDIDRSPNWVQTSALTPDVYQDNDAVIFDDTATNLSVNLPGVVAPAAVTITATNHYTIGGAGGIAGPVGLTKSAIGSLTLNTSNSFTGGVSVGGGSLIITNASALGTGPKILSVKSTAGNFAELHLNGASGPVILPPQFRFDTYGDGFFQGNLVNDSGHNIVNSSLNMASGGGNPKIAVLGGSLTFNGEIWCTNGSSAKTMQLAGVGTNTINGVIRNGSRASGLAVLGGTWILNNTNPYTGATTVGTNGSLVVNGSIVASVVTVQEGGQLRGNGSLGGALTVQPGGTLAPGTAVGTLGVNNDLTLQGTVVVEIARHDTGLTNDLVTGIHTNTYGGTLIVTNVGASALQVGDSFQLFAATNYAGVFAEILYPDGYTFTNSLGVDGRIWVAAAPSPTPPNFPPGGLAQLPNGTCSLTATGLVGAAYTLWAGTNVALPPMASTWRLLSNGTVTTSPFTILDHAATNFPQRFYRFSTP
jgi:autotransporter-associated beta strand protein